MLLWDSEIALSRLKMHNEQMGDLAWDVDQSCAASHLRDMLSPGQLTIGSLSLYFSTNDKMLVHFHNSAVPFRTIRSSFPSSTEATQEGETDRVFWWQSSNALGKGHIPPLLCRPAFTSVR